MSSFDPATVRQADAEFTPLRPQKFQDLLPAKDVTIELRQSHTSHRAIAELLMQRCCVDSAIYSSIASPRKMRCRSQRDCVGALRCSPVCGSICSQELSIFADSYRIAMRLPRYSACSLYRDENPWGLLGRWRKVQGYYGSWLPFLLELCAAAGILPLGFRRGESSPSGLLKELSRFIVQSSVNTKPQTFTERECCRSTRPIDRVFGCFANRGSAVSLALLGRLKIMPAFYVWPAVSNSRLALQIGGVE
jgi:hypothetical protein